MNERPRPTANLLKVEIERIHLVHPGEEVVAGLGACEITFRG